VTGPWPDWRLLIMVALGLTAIGAAYIIGALRTPRTPAPGTGAATPPAARQPPPRLPPAPAINDYEAAALDGLYRARVAVPPRGAYAAQIIADGLRERFPHLDDTTLGLVALDLHGYAVALATGLPDPRAALRAIVDSFGLAAEDLTRFGRLEEVHLDQH
jgi:hypothetical protein